MKEAWKEERSKLRSLSGYFEANSRGFTMKLNQVDLFIAF
jgi:hypothetical protein